MAKLNKLSVAYISLVKNPANKLDIVYKSSDAKFTDEKQIKITKSELKGLSMGAYCQKSEEEPPTSEESNPVLDLVKELSTKVEKMAGDLAAINSKVDKVPKSRQLTIDGERVKIDKAGESSSFQEFDFGALN